ncbi:glycoside hydrolase family 47 protein [Aaosphaeria arxii CBS 175.79]|uniref:alpha-1,2-Mannosidase n=1 Tax=Aaosphaeria arxii CBS 175.79 TaxID=1450172 RepID=A0A6A5XF98_9PLEO|nr:glycoside hydrolase family 47 protein [Aaosphaeria arxii CBS 175.79]KAF2011752.1 glycoside hydrolase family 47 protein [Aaosphaeria arxii CBS 175.79]
MLRYRRYRVFVAFAVISLFALYKFGVSNASWRDGISTPAQIVGEKEVVEAVVSRNPRPEVALETKKLSIDVPLAKTSLARHTPPPIAPVDRPVEKPTPTPTPEAVADDTKPKLPVPTAVGGLMPGIPMPPGLDLPSSSVEAVHWKKASEYYPVPSASLQQLPTGAAKQIPKIQATFGKESEAAKADRVAKLGSIKETFKRSWDGYKKFAWLHDELKPKSGTFRDPFAGWGATLVDALDTLWIMGMKAEFEEAVKAVDQIDFTTAQRNDIPLFETTIRYLGGLLAAYDLSDKVHKNLLSKAVELAELLMSAFDTPNRMPQTYYYWKPNFSTGPYRASNHIVLAEIGSLSVEFTRLAQLTGESKYYDAIARITDSLEEFQGKTRLPGMWPTAFDASGCKRIDYSDIGEPFQQPLAGEVGTQAPAQVPHLSPGGNKYIPLDLPPPIVFTRESAAPAPKPAVQVPEEPEKEKVQNWAKGTSLDKEKTGLTKRQLDLPEEPLEKAASPVVPATALPASPTAARPECEEQGFDAASEFGSEEYTLGGMSDSTYEYLPKEWLLLGGRVEKYQKMYEQSMDVVKKNLIFRPMLPNNDDILFSGKLRVSAYDPEEPNKKGGDLEGENAHLTCFAGGMFGMGAKIFNRADDLELAKKLTHGCVWSYNMTATGIMPEAFLTIPCESMTDCTWNETHYKLAIDPNADSRVTSYKSQMESYEVQRASASAWYASEMAAFTGAHQTPAPALIPTVDVLQPAVVPPLPQAQDDLRPAVKKRWVNMEDVEPQITPEQRLPIKDPLPPRPHANLMVEGETEDGEHTPSPVSPDFEPSTILEPAPSRPVFPVIYSPKPPLSHEEYVKQRVQEDRLPPGVTALRAKNYILRPEAIESVWYMYRITGDPYWREAGWQMFEAVNTHTATVYGNSAIDDVTKQAPDLLDESESFWLAETLKYFYLLFADENVVSLDEWVLNTEAHPFRRPT